ncbi:MAG: hypothetical protein DRH33_03155 [Candidatus Nealsonbacteria bacterium]|nr:MAG: hypothetical protein DRH33_03155 [Candidatus Nealsonbacteria bacterium]
MVDNIKDTINIIDYLEFHFEEFTPTQKRISDYILSNYQEVLFLTAEELALKINTTSSSVVRFAQEIGYNGYPDFRKNLRNLISKRLNINGQSEKAKQYKPFKDNNILDMSILNDAKSINELIEMKDNKKIEKFVKLILQSKNKYIAASRTSFSLGHFLYFKMRKIVPNVFFLNNYDQGIFDTLQEIKPKDMFIAISFPRYTNLTVDLAKYAKSKRAKVISITNGRISPLYKISEVCLFCPYKGFTFFNSNVAAMALINAIISRIFGINYHSGIENLKKEDAIIKDFNIWFKEKGI